MMRLHLHISIDFGNDGVDRIQYLSFDIPEKFFWIR